MPCSRHDDFYQLQVTPPGARLLLDNPAQVSEAGVAELGAGTGQRTGGPGQIRQVREFAFGGGTGRQQVQIPGAYQIGQLGVERIPSGSGR